MISELLKTAKLQKTIVANMPKQYGSRRGSSRQTHFIVTPYADTLGHAAATEGVF